MTDPEPWATENEYETPDYRSWWQRYLLLLVIAGVLGVLFLLALPSILARDQIDGLKDDVNELSNDLSNVRGVADANKAALDEANRLLIVLGEPPVSVPDVKAEQDDPDPNDPEQQDPEVNDPDPFDDPELQDGELDDPEAQDSEFDDPEVQDPEIDDPEIQDPEINDPDPPDDMSCPPKFAPQELILNAPGGQVTLFVCIWLG